MKTIKNFHGLVEKAIEEAKCARRELRYYYFLRRLPDDVLHLVARTLDKDLDCTAGVVYMAHRVASLLRKPNPRRIVDPSDKALQDASAQIVGDCLREWLRRTGVLAKCEPLPDPYAGFGPGVVEIGEKAGMLKDEARLLLDKLILPRELPTQ